MVKKFLPVVAVVIIIIGFFGFVIYKDSQSEKSQKAAASNSAQTDQLTSQVTSAPIQKSQQKTVVGDQQTAQQAAQQTQQSMTNTNSQSTQTLQKPTNSIDASKSYMAVLHTDKGDITIALNAKETPITANNFVTLSRKHFYDNTIFHRVIKGFMIQGGDPTGTGSGGPGYRFDDEKFSGSYDRGTVAMANAGPNTNGSQFFIMHQKQDLPPNYVIFGHVTAGMDAVDKIAESEVTSSGSGENSKPVTPTAIKGVDITET